MAKQVGQLQLIGTIHNLTFSKTPFGNIAKLKSGPTRNAVLKKENFARTRENAADFKTAVRAGTLIRHALFLTRQVSNVWLNGRMNRLLLKTVRSDKIHGRGKKAMPPDGIAVMKGFEINHEITLAKKLKTTCKAKINAAKGTMQVTIPPFIPKNAVKPPMGATHFQIISAGAALDFNKNKYLNDHKRTTQIAITRKKTAPIELHLGVAATTGQSLVLAVGIIFFKMTDGVAKPLKGGAMKIVAVTEVLQEEIKRKSKRQPHSNT